MSALTGAWQPWIQTLGWTLLHFLWQATLIGAGYGLARALLPVRRCDARYAAGLVALALMALCPVLTFVSISPDQVAPIATAIPLDTGAPMVANAAPVLSRTVDVLGPVLPWVVLLWGCGVLMMFSRAARQWRALQLVVTRWATPDAALQRVLVALSGRFGLARRIRVLVSERIDTPTLIGWLKPVILLPAAVVLGFPANQLELILAHELGHLRRYDHLVNLGQALLETLLFYHPVVHWVSRDVRNEREICCDALVLRLTAGEPREYARTLAALEEIRQVPSQLALAATGGLLVDRVRRIVGMPEIVQADRGDGARLRIATVAVVVAICALLRLGSGGIVELDAPRLVLAGAHAISAGSLIDRAAFVALDPRRVPRAAAAFKTDGAMGIAPPMPPLATAAGRALPPATTMAPATETVVPSTAVAVQAPTVDIQTKPAASIAAQAMLAAASAASALPAVVTLAKHVAPVPLRRVAPQYPTTARQKQIETVDLEFQIAADGSVGQIKVVGGSQDGPFEKAAERALQQWRFDPRSVADDAKAHYTQSFVFAQPGGERKGDVDCIMPTGSHICRRSNDGNAGTVLDMRAGVHTLQVAD